MQRIDTLTKAVDLFGPGKHGFKDGNPGEGIVPTGLNAKFFNDVQEEVASFIEWAGIALSEADSTQLRQALIAKFQARNANLTALSGLAGAANKLPYFTAADTMALATVTELGAAPLDSAGLTGSPTAPTPAFGSNNNRIATMAALQAVRTDIFNQVYPVGSIYINATNATNPATLLGFGTWNSVGVGRVLIGHSSGDALFGAAGNTGGARDAVVVAHTHTGATNAAGNHSHTIGWNAENSPNGGPNYSLLIRSAGSYNGISYYGTTTNGDHAHSFTTASAGSSGTNANLPPYLVVYMWTRVS